MIWTSDRIGVILLLLFISAGIFFMMLVDERETGTLFKLTADVTLVMAEGSAFKERSHICNSTSFTLETRFRAVSTLLLLLLSVELSWTLHITARKAFLNSRLHMK
jgi:hypothetical protein